jgi:hypothetical protein
MELAIELNMALVDERNGEENSKKGVLTLNSLVSLSSRFYIVSILVPWY